MTGPQVGRPASASIVVIASTFPASATDEVPAFVRDQLVALSVSHPELRFVVVAPHDRRSATADFNEHAHYLERRFHYFWPRRFERLAGRGIMPALKQSPLMIGVVPFLFLGEFLAVLRTVRAERPVLIYAHWFTPQAVVAYWVSRLTKTPFVFTTHASDVSVWRKVPVLGRRIVRKVSRTAVAISAVSSRSAQKLTSFFSSPEEAPLVHLVPMGVTLPAITTDATRRQQVREELGLDGRVALFIGRLVEKKGLPYLLRALRVPGVAADWNLVIAGDGPLNSSLRDLVSELGLNHRVRFTGFISGDEKRAYLQAADVMVVPSIIAADGDAEGLPVALLEGLSNGLTCIATRESGADDIITDGVNGYLCVERDPQGIAEKLRIVEALTEEQSSQLAQAAVTLAERFEWGNIAAQHYDLLFASILERKLP